MNIVFTHDLPLSTDKSLMASYFIQYFTEVRKKVNEELPQSSQIYATVTQDGWTFDAANMEKLAVYKTIYKRQGLEEPFEVYFKETRKVLNKRLTVTVESISEDVFNTLKKANGQEGGGLS